MAPTLTTDRLVLSMPAPCDLEDMAAMWAHPAVYAMIGGRPFTREEVWQRLLRYIGHWHALRFGGWTVRTHAGAYVGDITLMDSRRATDPSFEGTPEAGWALAPDMHGQGYAAEALAAMFGWADAQGIARTVCIISPENAPSIRLAERFGFVSQGQATYRDAPINLYARERS